MTWYPNAPQGRESRKVRFDVLPYMAKGGIDIGCGPEKVWPHLLGIDDHTDTRLFGIPSKPDIVMHAGALGMFANDYFDCVFSSHTLEHMADYRAVLKEWWRIVKPGGTLVLYLPHADHYPRIGTPGANPDHKHDFQPADIIATMQIVAPDWTLEVDETRSADLEYSFLQVWRKGAPGSGQAWPAPEPTQPRAGVVRVGGFGDALWASSVCAHLKEQGYHVTVYTAWTGAEVIRHDPNIDRIVEIPDQVMDDDDLIAYWAHEAVKFARWINLIGSVETRLLAHPNEIMFFQPHAVRQKFMNANYLETIHDYAGLPHDFRQKYYPTADETAWARAMHAKLTAAAPGPLVVLNPGGSGPTKWWPHAQQLMQRLAAAGVYSVLLGKLYDDALEPIEPWAHVVGLEWPVRAALAFALQADVVVATESLIANAVAFERLLKVVTLSHSSNENLTKHWPNTAAFGARNLACHPCHRIHPQGFQFCARDTNTGFSACQASVDAITVGDFVLGYLGRFQPAEARPLVMPAQPALAEAA